MTDNAPKFWSLAFHCRYFPRLLARRLRPTPAPNIPLPISSSEARLGLVLAACGAMAIAAIRAEDHYPWLADGLLLMAASGLLYVLLSSLKAAQGLRPCWQGFLLGLFTTMLFLGLSAGAILGIQENGWHKWLHLAAGVFAGYWLGLLAGFQGQRLGFFARAMEKLSLPANIGLLIVDLLLLFG